MRRYFIAGNWKMNLSRNECTALASGLAEKIGPEASLDVAVCPPSVYLDAVVGAAAGSAVAVGAQNMYFEEKGAFTGEISAGMLLDIGCQYVILGHSERRHILGETDKDVNHKTLVALEAGLTPIVCVGETIDQRKAGKTLEVIKEQFDGSLAGLTAEQMAVTVIAYEPVWAIGTGEVATPEQAEEVHAYIRKLLTDKFGAQTAESVRIQYGGSVKPSNASELLSQPNVDGALVGGASLKVEDFMGIIDGALIG